MSIRGVFSAIGERLGLSPKPPVRLLTLLERAFWKQGIIYMHQGKNLKEAIDATLNN